jgi:hypothetical protein
MTEDGHGVDISLHSLLSVRFTFLELEVLAHDTLEHVLYIFNDSFEV